MAKVSNNTTFVLFFARLLEGVATDFEHLKVVTQAMQIAHGVIEGGDRVVAH